MLSIIIRVVAKASLQSFFRKLHRLSNRCLGIGNHANMAISGEDFCMKYIIENYQLSCVFDVGAHDGEFARHLRDSGFQGTIHAFEPHPVTFDRLLKNTRDDDQIKCCPFALSNVNGATTIYDKMPTDLQNGTHHASLYSEVLTDLHKSDTESYVIQLQTLDTYVQNAGIKIVDFLKIVFLKVPPRH
jgi:FkbM family methyltransferase